VAQPCISDTPSVNLELTDDDELEAFVIPAAAGTIDVSAGAAVRVGASSGFTTNANGLLVDVQGPGLAIAAGGIGKVTTASGVGWGPGSADDTVAHNFNIARGSTTAISSWTHTVSVASTVATRITFHAWANMRIRTSWADLFELTATLDEVGCQLQSNYNGAGWIIMDRYELAGNRQQVTANLRGLRTVLASNGTAQTMQYRTVVTGGIATATAVQGRLERSFYRGAIAIY
jgi:hypothetical protein